MIYPKEWTPFNSYQEKLTYLKNIELIPITQSYIKQFYYTGPYVNEPTICTVEGYSHKTTLIIKVCDTFHCIHADYLKDMQTGRYRMPEEYIVFDLETTGFSPKKHKIIEFAGVKYRFGVEVESYSTLINPNCDMSPDAEKINHISKEMVADAPCIQEVLPLIYNFLGSTPLVAHNAPFDSRFLNVAYSEAGLLFENVVIDTLKLCRKAFPYLNSHSLSSMKNYLNIKTDTEHRSLPDVYATAEIYKACSELLSDSIAV